MVPALFLVFTALGMAVAVSTVSLSGLALLLALIAAPAVGGVAFLALTGGLRG